MIFQPALNVFLLLLLCAPVAALAIIALTKAKGRDRALWAMRLVTLLACFVLFLRPGIPGGATQTLATDTDIVLVVDTTASIVAEDWEGGAPRLDGVRQDVQAIVDEYPGARFALITFDASADLRMPLTTDTTALVSSLDVLRPEVTSQSRGSSIGIANQLLAAIALAVVLTIVARRRTFRVLWVVAVPLAFVTVVTVTASLQKIFSTVPQVGYFANHVAFRDALAAGETSFGTATSMAAMEAVVRNTMIQGVLSVTFLVLSVIVITISLIKVIQAVRPGAVVDHEDPEVASHRFAPAGLFASREERAVEKDWEALPAASRPTRGH